MRKPIAFISLCVILISSFLFYESFKFPSTSTRDIGAAFIPRVYFGILITLGVILIVQEMIKRPKSYDRHIKRVLLSMGLFLTYLLLVPILGFYISTPLLVFLFLWIANGRKKLFLTLIPIGITLFVFVVFEVLLKIQIPKGIFFS